MDNKQKEQKPSNQLSNAFRHLKQMNYRDINWNEHQRLILELKSGKSLFKSLPLKNSKTKVNFGNYKIKLEPRNLSRLGYDF